MDTNIINSSTDIFVESNLIFHNTGKRWSIEDINYLIEWYEVTGAEEMAFALGRTIKSTEAKVCQLRKKGLMKKKKSCCSSSKLNNL